MKFKRRFVMFLALFSILSCRPVWTIGWPEMLIFGGLILLFAGPTVWRFYRRYRKFREYEAKKKERR